MGEQEREGEEGIHYKQATHLAGADADGMQLGIRVGEVREEESGGAHLPCAVAGVCE